MLNYLLYKRFLQVIMLFVMYSYCHQNTLYREICKEQDFLNIGVDGEKILKTQHYQCGLSIPCFVRLLNKIPNLFKRTQHKTKFRSCRQLNSSPWNIIYLGTQKPTSQSPKPNAQLTKDRGRSQLGEKSKGRTVNW